MACLSDRCACCQLALGATPTPPLPLPPSPWCVQLPDCFFWELQYRALIPNQPLGGWDELEVATGGMEVEVTGLDPGTKYAFRWGPHALTEIRCTASLVDNNNQS